MSILSDATRLTVVVDGQRTLELWGVDIEAHLQDEGRTLKLFVKRNPDKPSAPRSGWLAGPEEIKAVADRIRAEQGD